MQIIEQFLIQLFLRVMSLNQWNETMRDPQIVAILVGALVAMSGAWLGVYLLLRKRSLTSDAISHSVLLGIVVGFFTLIFLGREPDLNSPILIIGATGAGVLTVFLTELVQKSGLVKSDAALGLVFTLLFAVAVILISRFADDVHLDTDAVLVGEIGLASSNLNSYCFENCADITITPDDPQAETGRRCTNCTRGGISPRDPDAEFEEYCTNCGTYSAAQAWSERLIDEAPVLAYFPKSLSVMLVITLLNAGFITLFYKELKLSSFDEQLAKALGFRPAALTYALMTLVSLTAVGAFDAVGAILVVAFFVIPAASAYLLVDRLGWMLLIAPLFGVAGAVTGYELARGWFLGLPVSAFLRLLDNTIGIGGYTTWNVSISASIVLMTFFFFIVTWIASPRYGLVSQAVHRWQQNRRFKDKMLLGHIANHEGDPDAHIELAVDTLHEHLGWEQAVVETHLQRTMQRGWVQVTEGLVQLTEKGRAALRDFQQQNLQRGWQNDAHAFAAVGD